MDPDPHVPRLHDAELAACIRELDKRMKHGGDRRSDDFKAPSEALKIPGKTAEATADILGTSRQKVEKVRTILRHGDDSGTSGSRSRS